MDEVIRAIATTGISEIVRLAINTYIRPKFENLEKGNYLVMNEQFEEYLKRSYNKNLYMSTIAFKNQQKTIEDLYIPLTVTKYPSANSKDNIEIYVDRYQENFIPLHKKVLLVDNAGMGKSTIIKYLYLCCISENKGIPILVELRKLDKDISIIDFIMNEINGIRECFKKEDILNLIDGGGFIFYFDGYDEIANESKQEVTENLQDFISKTSVPKDACNNFIISSRDESSLSCFSDFQRFDIKALTKEEAYKLICKYDNNGEASKALIEKLKSEKDLSILDEFLVNPLMVSLLYVAFDYRRVIPYKKQIFYRQVYDALFEDHDRTKGGAYVHPKKSKLDIEDFHRVLRALGFVTLSKGISYYKEELIERVAQAKKITAGIQFKENDFIYDIIQSVPLFIKDGIEYRWAHKSFQEYFAASYICFDAKENQSKYLLMMIDKDKISKYYNVLDFCYDIDNKEFLKVIIYPLINEFIEYHDNAFDDDKYKKLNQEELDIIKNACFIYEEIFVKIYNDDEISIKNIDKQNPKEEFKAAFSNWKLVESHEAKYIINHYKDFNIAVGFALGNNNIESLFYLLSNKKNPIIKEITKKFNAESDKNFLKIIGNKEYIINKNNKELLSQEEAFYLVNNFLIDNSFLDRRFRKYLFNYDECVNLKSIIEIEINSKDDICL